MRVLRIHGGSAVIAASMLFATSVPAVADEDEASDGPAAGRCVGLPAHAALKSALTAARDQPNGGFNLDMWATVVNRDGIVCAVAFTGTDRGSQWPGRRVISAEKDNTAKA